MTNNLRNNATEKQGSNKLVLALVIAFVMLFAVDYLEQKYAPAQAVEAVNPLTPNKGDLFTNKTPQLTEIKPVEMQTENYDVQLDLVGGKITKLDLLNYVEVKDEDKLVSIFSPKDEESKVGMLLDAGWLSNKFSTPDANTVWSVDSQDADSVVLSYKNDKLTFYRTFLFNKDNFLTNIEDKVINNSNEAIQIAHYSQIHHIGEREDKLANSFTNFTGPEAMIDAEKTQADYKDLQDGQSFEVEGKNVWAGVTRQYFAGAIIPDNANTNTVKIKHNKVGEDNYYTVLVRSHVKSLEAGANLTEKFQVYAGPKSTKILEEQPVAKEIRLPSMLDYGWFHVIAKAIFDAMMFVDQYVNSLALSIIIITLGLKIVLFPLANKSYVSMAKMRKIQPEMKALQEKHGDDRQTLGLEMMNLYKKHQVSPASGCWPILIQIPIFFAMYKVILMSFEFRQAELGFWIHDMSMKDPFFVLPILMGISMIVQQRMNPQPLDETQKMVMNVMPIAFTVLFLFFPAGLVLYWLTNNVLSIAQQYIIMKREDAKDSK